MYLPRDVPTGVYRLRHEQCPTWLGRLQRLGKLRVSLDMPTGWCGDALNFVFLGIKRQVSSYERVVRSILGGTHHPGVISKRKAAVLQINMWRYLVWTSVGLFHQFT
jgi:hypothetical protein